jgi:hypothetical protein
VNFDEVPQFADHRYGKSVTCDELIPRHKHILSNDILLDVKIARDTFADEEIATFFQNAQEVKKTSQGEHLNSCISSPMRVRMKTILQEWDDFKSPEGRYSHLEMMARLGYASHAHQTPAIDRFDPTPTNLKKWWGESDGELPENFMDVVKLTITFINEGEIAAPNTKTTILPIYYYILNHCWSDGDFMAEPAERLSAALKSGIIVFEQVGGEHDASLGRYIHLRTQMALIAAEEEM